MKLLPGELPLISKTIYDLCGVVLDETKDYLIESRLSGIAEEFDCGSFSELHSVLRSNGKQAVVDKVVDAITTHETLFFRDTTPFQALEYKVFPELIDKAEESGRRSVRVWSAACSTGQEPLSIAMIISQMLEGMSGWNVSVLGTDISQSSIERAREGVFDDFELERSGRPDLTRKFFDRVDGRYRCKNTVLKLVQFRQANLLDDFNALGRFDVVFCRNVSIYFDAQTREDLFARIRRVMNPGGFLFLGSAEMMASSRLFERQEHCRTVVYRPLA